MRDLISRQAAIDRLTEYGNGRAVFISVGEAIIRIEQLPPAQPEQLEQCPIYGGMCAYPSDQCYDCPRHAGAKMGVTECIELPKSLGFDRRPEWPFGGDET